MRLPQSLCSFAMTREDAGVNDHPDEVTTQKIVIARRPQANVAISEWMQPSRKRLPRSLRSLAMTRKGISNHFTAENNLRDRHGHATDTSTGPSPDAHPFVITAQAVIQGVEQLDSGSPLLSARNDGYSLFAAGARSSGELSPRGIGSA